MSARPGSRPSPVSSPGRVAWSASSDGGGGVPTTRGSWEAPVMGLFSGLARSGTFRSTWSGVGSGGTPGDVRALSANADHVGAMPASTVAARAQALNLDMVDDLDLMMQRIDRDGRAGAGLLAE